MLSTSRSACTATTTRLSGRRPSARRTSTCSWSTRDVWSGAAPPTSQLRAVVTGAIQLVVVQERATAAGIDPDELAAIVAPVAVENVELGMVAGRSPGNETAAALMSILLLTAILTYGSVVLSGVVEEKATRVVEVLLARMLGPYSARRQGHRHRTARVGPIHGHCAGGARRHHRGRLCRRLGRQRWRTRLGRRVVRAWLCALRHRLRRARLSCVANRGRLECRRARELHHARRLLGLLRGRRHRSRQRLVTVGFALPGDRAVRDARSHRPRRRRVVGAAARRRPSRWRRSPA